MKKLFIALAAIALIIQAFLVFPAFAAQSSYILGDADGDAGDEGDGQNALKRLGPTANQHDHQDGRYDDEGSHL